MFPRSQNPSRIYDTLANFGSVSLLYPHQDLGWIVHFENEEGACEAESKMSEIYTVDSMKKIVRIFSCSLDEVIKLIPFDCSQSIPLFNQNFPSTLFQILPKVPSE